MYVITDPALVQSALRSKDLSLEPFMIGFAQSMLGLSDETMQPVRYNPLDEKEPTLLGDMFQAIHKSMSGVNLYRMNAEALNYVAGTFNNLGDVTEQHSLWMWLRDTLTLATSTALFGSHNPLIHKPQLRQDLWYVTMKKLYRIGANSG